MVRNTVKNDMKIMLIILLVAGICFIITESISPATDGYVEVRIDGDVFSQYPLNEDKTVMIKTENGNNELQISNKSAKIVWADCPDRICEKHGKISRNGESIICLPHKLVITIISEENRGVDAIA